MPGLSRIRSGLLMLGLSASLVACGSARGGVDEIMADYDDASPGTAVMVIRDGEVLLARGYGLADLEAGTPMAPDTQIRLASVTKQFVAMAIMILAEQGELDVDDPVTDTIPELRARYGDAITIRHLLTHTSGLPGYYQELQESSTGGRPRNAQGAQLYARWGESEFAPGEKHQYSNPGYEMLALIIERVSAVSFREFLATHIFAPLGMTSSQVYDHTQPEMPRRAYGYQSAEGGGFKLHDDHVLNDMMGAGGIYCTLEDLYKWDQALYSDVLVSSTTLEQAFTKGRLNSGDEFDYGFGWGLDEAKGRRRLLHSGGWVGFRTQIIRYPDDKFTVIVLANRGDARPGKLAESIADLYFEQGSP